MRHTRPGEPESLGIGLPVGSPHYRAYVGRPENYDLSAAATFNLITRMGLRQYHTLVDVGCGSLRVGRLLIPYLNAGKYVGIEPIRWLVDEGIAHEVGADLVRIKRPKFHISDRPGILATLPAVDFVLAIGIFSHSPQAGIASWLRAIAAALAPAGALLATFRLGDEDYTGTEWCYPATAPYTRATIERFASDAGLRLLLPATNDTVRTWTVFAKPGFDAASIV